MCIFYVCCIDIRILCIFNCISRQSSKSLEMKLSFSIVYTCHSLRLSQAICHLEPIRFASITFDTEKSRLISNTTNDCVVHNTVQCILFRSIVVNRRSYYKMWNNNVKAKREGVKELPLDKIKSAEKFPRMVQ